MQIKRLTRDDFLRVSVLIKNVRETIENKYFFMEVKDVELEQMLVRGTVFGAFRRGELVGISALELDEFPHPVRDDFGVSKSQIGEIMLMAVREQNRGRGVVSCINNELIKCAKSLGAKAVGISVHPENFAAIKSFLGLGKVQFLGFESKSLNEQNIIYGVKI